MRVCRCSPGIYPSNGANTNVKLSMSIHSKPSPEAAFLKEAIVMTHQQMRFHLPHSIQQDADQNEHAGTAEKGGHGIGNLHFAIEQNGNDRDYR